MNRNGLMNGSGLVRPDGAPLIPAKDKRPTVTTCVASNGLWHAPMAISLFSCLYASAAHAKVSIKTVFGEKSSLMRAQLVKMALAENADYVFFVSPDLIFPPNTLAWLLQKDRDIIGAMYLTDRQPFRPEGSIKPTMADLSKGGMHEADFLPLGLTLIKTAVFKKMEEPWFAESWDMDNPDSPFMADEPNFCFKAQALGFRCWAEMELSYQVARIGSNPIPTPRPQPMEDMMEKAKQAAAAEAAKGEAPTNAG